VSPAALAATAISETLSDRIVAPVVLFVTLRKSCMNGKPIGDVKSSLRSPREISRTMAYPKPMMPLTRTLPTMAIGTFLAGWMSSSAK
jgi:hypothetical protein